MGFYEFFNLLKAPGTMNYDRAKPYNEKARGIPLPRKGSCSHCNLCTTVCPTKSIVSMSSEELSIDYGSCLQCGLCVDVCVENYLSNSGFLYAFSHHREELKLKFTLGTFTPKKYDVPENVLNFQKLTNKNGFNYREVAASGNNSVECELSASFNYVFDSEGEQVKSVASPKHADAIVYSGPIGENMEKPLNTAFECMPSPKALIAMGTEAISGGVFQKGKPPITPDLYVAGDPPRPDVAIQSFRFLMGKFKFSFQNALFDFMFGKKND